MRGNLLILFGVVCLYKVCLAVLFRGYKFYLFAAHRGGLGPFQFFEIARLGLQNRIGGAGSNRPVKAPSVA